MGWLWEISIIPSIIILAAFGLSQDSFSACNVCGDFNGDGYDDLAIGVPQEGLSGTSDVGAVNVIYGSAKGLHKGLGLPDQFWHQNSAGIADTVEFQDCFGSSLPGSPIQTTCTD